MNQPPTSLAEKTAAYKDSRRAAKANSKIKAKEWKDSKAALKEAEPNLFNPDRYSCWLTGSDKKQRL